MASLIPLIQDILPMILPSSIHITKSEEILPPASNGAEDTDTADGVTAAPRGEPRVISRDAIVDKTDKMCATVMIAKPKSSSAIHHHGEQDAIIYAASGNGILLTGPSDGGLEPKRHELSKGDFAFVPAWTEHQALNESEEDDLMWVVIRTGPSPVEVNLTGWEGPEAKGASRK
ncbi:RmlC-like cupin domain-containing protein [Coniochaeta sp. 2T2.1]|nr:RmlC-like cupin domain-containing protein [Coniochaeta sp. 2T2.1]